METSGVGCSIPVWRKSMLCSGVPPCVQVKPCSSLCFHSCLSSTSTARMPHWWKTSNAFPLWWCIRKNVPAPSFAATGTDRTVTATNKGNHDCLSSGTTYHCFGFVTLHMLKHNGDHLWRRKHTSEHAFAEPSVWLTSWLSTSKPAVRAVWYGE